MTVTVDPTKTNKNSHHIKLTDSVGNSHGFICEDKKYRVAVSPYPAMASQLRQGRGKHADRVPPFEDIAMSDFSGGMAMLHYDEDTSRYLDGKRCDTSEMGEVINGGLESYIPGIRDFDENWPGNVTWQALYSGGTTSVTKSFSAGASYNANSVVVILKKTGAPTGDVTVYLLDSGDSTLKSKALTIGTDCLTDLVSERVEFEFSSAQALTASTTYKVKVEYTGGSTSAYVEVAVDGSTEPYYRVLDDTSDFDGIFFELNSGLYFVTQPLDRSASKIYLYGDRGVADSNSGDKTKLNDATKSWTNDEWIGGVVKIIAEDGTEEREPYRTITDNDGTSLTSTAWNIAHTTETEYVILYPKWQLVQTLSNYVIDVTVGPSFAILALDGVGFKKYIVRENGGAYEETVGAAGIGSTNKVLASLSAIERGGAYTSKFYSMYTDTSSAKLTEYPLALSTAATIRTDFGALLPKARPFNDTDYSASGADSYINNGRIVFSATAVNGNIGHLELENPVSIEGARYINFNFVANSNSYDAGDLEFGFADSDGNTKWIDLPALTAATSAFVELEISPAPGSTANSYEPEDITKLYLRSTKSVTDTFLILEDSPMIGMTMHGIADNQGAYYFPRNTQANNMIEYIGGSGEITSRPWIFTWKGPWYQSGDSFVKLYLGELEELEHPDNGKGVCVNDVYLYFNVGETIQRYYSGHLDSVGPDVDYGLPANRRGIPITAASYPGRVLYGIDAGADSYSSVIMRRGHGWHEFYRAPKDHRIRKIHAYARADTTDQLFVLEGGDILSLPISINPRTDSNYEYNYESVLETSRVYGGLRETEKYYHAITLITENLSGSNRWVEVDYKTSENSSWTNISTDFNTSPRQRQALISTNNTTGRWIQFRFRMYTDDRTETPKLVSAVIDALERLDSANTYTFNIRLKQGYDHDLRGKKEDSTGNEKWTQLASWVDDPKPLTLNSVSPQENGKLVFIEPERCQMYYKKVDDPAQEIRMYQLTLLEVE